jgi:cytochrome bd-type quinol oxidase subunit 2
VILDGFDLGVGILLLVQPETVSRDHMVDSITPTWDGNETWIIMAGATLLAAFPVAYAILLPAFYLPIILMLLALGFRGVSVQFRVQSKQHRRFGWPNARRAESAFRRKCSRRRSSSGCHQPSLSHSAMPYWEEDGSN